VLMPVSPPPYDNRWEKFLVSELLESLRKEAEEAYLQKKGEEYEGSKSALKKADELRKSILVKESSAESTFSTANSFIKEVAGELGAFLSNLKLMGSFRDGSANAKSMRTFLNRNSRVETAMHYCELQLRLHLPDLVGIDENRWPGHVSYRAALNHFVAVCLRVHSILPDVLFEEVTFAAARRILVPALAHNLKFFAKHHPDVYRKFVHDDFISLRQGIPLKQADAVKGILGENRFASRKWARLFNLCLEFGKNWPPDRIGGLYVEMQSLLRDYEADPRSSRLWRDLSILAAGDMAVDEMLVSWVIDDVGGDPRAQATGPLINCARSRFGLLRYAYLMSKEAEEFREDFTKGSLAAHKLLETLEKESEQTVSESLAKEVFGWAYLLSRHNLLGRNTQVATLSAQQTEEAATLLYAILNELRLKAASPIHRALALRYLVGFMTNPRFIKPLVKIRVDPRNAQSAFTFETVGGLITDAGKDALIPQSITRLSMARSALHSACQSGWGTERSARDLQSAIGHYATILKELDAPSKAGIMDGEVIAWALPEMHFTIGKLAEHDPESRDDWQDVQKSLQTMGEIKYGVFFSPKEEAARIESGLNRAIFGNMPR
jgi:hypothetical protein